MPGGLWVRFLSGPDINSLGLTGAEIIEAVEGAIRAHGEGRAIIEPRVHLVPGDGGHFNVLRGHLAALGPPGGSGGGLSGGKVDGDSARRERKPGGDQRRSHPLARLGDGFVSQANDMKRRQPRRNLHLDVNRAGFDALKGDGGNPLNHAAPLCRNRG